MKVKADDELRLPMNSSISITLDKLWTVTEVEFDKRFKEDKVVLSGGDFSKKERLRVVRHLDRIRGMAGVDIKARVVTRNNFKKASGMASSASGFAALSLAGSKAVGLNLSEKELSVLARLGSGSACRSIPGGIVIWHKGSDNKSSYAESIKIGKSLDIRVLLIEVDQDGEKEVGSTRGMDLAKTSPYFTQAIKRAERNLGKIKLAIRLNKWEKIGEVVETECFRLHVLAMTSKPAILYWEPASLRIMNKVFELREKGIMAYFTADAGPHIHVICKRKDEKQLMSELKKLVGVKQVISCGVGERARLLS